MKHSQRGYYNMDFTGLVIGGIVVGIVVGVLLTIGLPWLWQLLKPLIHAWTA